MGTTPSSASTSRRAEAPHSDVLCEVEGACELVQQNSVQASQKTARYMVLLHKLGRTLSSATVGLNSAIALGEEIKAMVQPPVGR